ncbi:16S rRNA (cytidine(1402)-2'-O)-methyltransferase [Neptunicoccus cionae]|uniref:16S rRNA (cytidine(1402)-2'-O)-methyltransferase n=1 Tax=Neptunicoccus cionae TaxID=2035344 RepID=UPI000C769955|nr:16S rRNA (cytidine(1402)-2'-O)-methyltransferase [Amylibacter cionae]PLS23156.1 16S rRNA (cytidine(1402)-2'-O)-methyltransferase [Amylibacter cionae]
MHAGKIAAGLHLVATPIGAARDITLRALDILANADVLAAEDTRNTRRLLDIHGVKLGDRRLLAYHDHNGAQMRPQLLKALKDGASVAYVSDAGTPMVADPGFDLARAVIAQDLPVYAAPGASALLAALCVAGQPTDRFFFAGFAPNKTSARKKFFTEFSQISATLVFYESPKRAAASLRDMCSVFGNDRPAAFCRELTKKFEETCRGTLGELAEEVSSRESVKGEVVIVLGPPLEKEVVQDDVDTAIKAALTHLRVKDAASEVAETFGLPRKEIYQRALELKEDS